MTAAAARWNVRPAREARGWPEPPASALPPFGWWARQHRARYGRGHECSAYVFPLHFDMGAAEQALFNDMGTVMHSWDRLPLERYAVAVLLAAEYTKDDGACRNYIRVQSLAEYDVALPHVHAVNTALTVGSFKKSCNVVAASAAQVTFDCPKQVLDRAAARRYVASFV